MSRHGRTLLEAFGGSVRQDCRHHFAKNLAGPAVVVAMIIADHIAPLTVNLGYFVGIDVTTSHFAEDDIADFVIGVLLKNEKASTF